MNDLISRQAAIDRFEPWLKVDGYVDEYNEGALNMLKAVLYELKFLPSAQPDPLTVTIDYEPSKDVYDRLKQAMRDAPILLLPSEQPEIIRCKECKYWTHIKRTDRYWCKTDDGLYDLNPSPDDFCSRAERRTDE